MSSYSCFQMGNMSQSDAADSESTEEGLRSWNIQVKPMQ